MDIVETKVVTADEFYLMPDPNDGSKRELVRGEIVSMPSPGFEHGEVQSNIAYLLKSFLIQNRIDRICMESGAVVERNPDTVRGPDVSYYSKERLPLGLRVVKYNDQPPDLCVEVVSPLTTRRQINDKLKEYFFAGVRAVWVVDPEDRSVLVYREPLEGRMLKEGSTLDGGDVLPGFSCKVADFFG